MLGLLLVILLGVWVIYQPQTVEEAVAEVAEEKKTTTKKTKTAAPKKTTKAAAK